MELLFIKMKKTVGKQFGVKEMRNEVFNMLSLKYLLNTHMEMESRQRLYKSRVQVRSLG